MLIRIVDVESTGLDPAVHRICEVATVDLHDFLQIEGEPPTFKRGRMWSSLVDPERDIPPEASAIHDIVDEMVKDSPKIGDLLPTITEGSPDYYCAHNSRFDSKFINPKDSVWLDTYRIALWLWPSAPSHSNACLRYYLNLKLSGGGMGLPSDRRGHCALWDAYVTAAILRRAFMTGATIEQMLEVSTQPALLPRLHFGEHAGKPIEDVPSSYLDWMLMKFDRATREDEVHTAFCELQRRRNLTKFVTER